MEVNPVSLANLQPGRVTTKAEREAGKNMLIAVIVEALRHTVQDDDAVRKHLCKVSDFEVTEAARAKVLEEKALLVYRAIFENIKKRVIGGQVVSINGFGSFRVERVEPGVEVGIERWTAATHAILKTDERIKEVRSAVVRPGSWLGEPIAGEYILEGEKYAQGVTQTFDYVRGAWVDIDGSPAGKSFSSSLTVTAVGSDGVTREYDAPCLNVGVSGVKQLRSIVDSDDQQAWLIVSDVSKQAAMAKWLEAEKRGLDWVNPVSRSWEIFSGLVPSVALDYYPQNAIVVRPVQGYRRTYSVRRVSNEQFRAWYGWNEDALRALDSWPVRIRNFDAQVRVDFRKGLLDAQP